MDPRRVERTLLHRKIGLFGYSREFARRGIISPYVQIFLIARIITEWMSRAQELPSLSDEAELRDWLRNAVDSQTTSEATEAAKTAPLTRLMLSTTPLVAWNPYRDFAELLNAYCGPKAYDNVAHKLNRYGYRVGIEELSELTQPFLKSSLGRAVKSFDPKVGIGRESEWLTTVFYRFALKHVISDKHNKLALDEIDVGEVQSLSPSPLEELEAEERESAMSELPDAMDHLPEEDRRALELYFGFHGRERTLSEIAEELGTSQYLARARIVRSLAALASKLGVQGDLDEREYLLIQMVFGEGMEIGVTAKKLNITERETRKILERVNEKFTEGLRKRTKKPWKHDSPQRPKEEIEMSTPRMLTDEQIVVGLKQLHQAPELRPSEVGLHAKLIDNWVPVDRVREVVFKKRAGEGLIPKLEEKGVDLGWLITPDPSTERADLPADYIEWGEELQAIAARSWITAEALYVRTLELAVARQIVIPDERKTEAVERVYRTLGGIAQAIEGELPRNLRRTGECYFRMEKDDRGEVFGGWDGSGHEQRFEMKTEIKFRGTLLGELSEEVADLLAETIIDEIFEDEMTLPGFRRLDQSTTHTVWLKLLPRITEESLSASDRRLEGQTNSQ